jgi:osmoprotectant transport system permease protein
LISLRAYFLTIQIALTLFLCLSLPPAYSQEFTVASKRFTESYILAEIIANAIKDKSLTEVQIKQGMGSTGIVFNALRQGSVDIYPEYWGTLTKEILKTDSNQSLEAINTLLLPMGLRAGYFLGFNNTYAIALRKSLATRLNIHKISDLKEHINLRLGLSQEFLGRKDGWAGLSKIYQLGAFNPTGLEHGLGYQAVENNQIDLLDAYTTDPLLASGNFELLIDDMGYFSSYQALLIYKIQSVDSNPKIQLALKSLEQTLTNEKMQALNARVEVDRKTPKDAAKDYYTSQMSGNSVASVVALNNVSAPTLSSKEDYFAGLSVFVNSFLTYDFLRLTYQHTVLVFASLVSAALLGIPLGVWVYAKPLAGRYALAFIGIVQTIPSLALLSFLIFLVQSIGFLPAFIALMLYALLPIIESTYSGLRLVDPSVKEASKALGAGFWTQLIKIEIPLCRSSIISGVQVAAVWTTGTATIAAFVGAGGYGERIAQGLSTNNTELMLEGAVPAAVFSLLVRWLVSLMDKFFK